MHALRELFADFKTNFKRMLEKLKKIYSYFSSKKSFFVIIVIVYAFALGTISYSSSYSFNSRREQLGRQIANVALESDDNTVMVDITSSEKDSIEIANEFSNYKYNGSSISLQQSYNTSILTYNNKVREEKITTKLDNGEKLETSLIYPNAFSKEFERETNMYKFDDLNLYTKFNTRNGDIPHTDWGYLSSNLANKIADLRGVDNIENILRTKFSITYYIDGKVVEKDWLIAGIYESELGDAPLYFQRYGEFILSWKPTAKSIIPDNLSISLELHNSFLNNENIIEYFVATAKMNEFNFQHIKNKMLIQNNNLKEELINLYTVDNFSIDIVGKIISSILLLVFLTLVWLKIVKEPTQEININMFIILIFMCLLFAIKQIVQEIGQKFDIIAPFLLSSSQANIMFFLSIVLFIYVWIIMKIKHIKSGGEKNETQN